MELKKLIEYVNEREKNFLYLFPKFEIRKCFVCHHLVIAVPIDIYKEWFMVNDKEEVKIVCISCGSGTWMENNRKCYMCVYFRHAKPKKNGEIKLKCSKMFCQFKIDFSFYSYRVTQKNS